MAQIGKREFERIAGTGGMREGAGAARSRLADALRIDEVPRATLAAIAVLAVLAAVLGAVLLGRLGGAPVVFEGGPAAPEDAAGGASGEDAATEGGGAAGPEGTAGEGLAERERATLRVHVAGEVAAPGVYELPEGARVVDAVSAAGGFAPGADPDAINLAEPLSDGRKVDVPAAGEAAPGAASAAAPGGADAGKINVNTASEEELEELPGVGEVLAAAIVRERTENGPFASPEDLMRVSGIGEKKLENMIDRVAV